MTDELIFLHGRWLDDCIATVDKTFDYYALQFMTKGGVELLLDDRRYEMYGNWLWPCSPGSKVRFTEYPRGSPWEHRYVAFTGPKAIDWVTHGLWPAEPQQIETGEASKLASRFDELYLEMQRSGKFARMRAVNILERILVDRADLQATAVPERHEWLSTVLRRLGDFDLPEPDYAELAMEIGMSLTALRRKFREATKSSMHDYRLDCRVTIARELLGDTDLPIKQIATQLGYSDIFFFTRQFHQRVGAAPAAYRKSRQG